MLTGYRRVSKAGGTQMLDLQRGALLGAGIPAEQLYETTPPASATTGPGRGRA